MFLFLMYYINFQIIDSNAPVSNVIVLSNSSNCTNQIAGLSGHQYLFIYLFIIYLGSIIVQMVLPPKLKK